jgi:hypothetical protein
VALCAVGVAVSSRVTGATLEKGTPAHLADLVPDRQNRRRHNPRNVGMIERALGEVGAARSIVIDEDGMVLAGNATVEAAAAAGIDRVQVVDADGETIIAVRRSGLSDEQKRKLAMYDNRTAELAEWDTAQIAADLEAGLSLDGLFSNEEIAVLLGEAADDILADNKPSVEQARRTLAERFIVPPFSVLDARQGYWQERKRAWLALGIEGEVGRNVSGRNVTSGKNSAMHRLSGRLAAPDALESGGSTVSVFDPVLSEIAYRWFSPPGGLVLDPFAGGSVRGIVALGCGRPYTGIDLRPEQVAANEEQAARICASGDAPTWLIGDSRDLASMDTGDADLVFTCPPYYDLEVYSDDSRDLSTAGDYAAFLADYRAIIAASVAKLRQDRFACIVVGDIRDKRGMYRNFVSDTIAAFQDAGAMLYNEAILVTACGSLPIRAGKQFASSRKLGKTHQNVLVFVKGDPKVAVEACGDVDVWVPDETEAAE